MMWTRGSSVLGMKVIFYACFRRMTVRSLKLWMSFVLEGISAYL